MSAPSSVGRPVRLVVSVAVVALAGAGLATWWRPDLLAALPTLVLQRQLSIADSETAAVYVSPLFWALLVGVLALEARFPVDTAQPVFSRGFFQDGPSTATSAWMRRRPQPRLYRMRGGGGEVSSAATSRRSS